MDMIKSKEGVLLTKPGGALPYMGYIGTCRCEGYGFQAVYSRIGYINQSVWVQNRVSLFPKLTSWLKILSRLRKPGIAAQKYKKIKSASLNLRKSASTVSIDGGTWGVYSSIAQQNSADLALVQGKGSRVPAAHPHPEIPKVPPGVYMHFQILRFDLFTTLIRLTLKVEQST